MNAKGKKRGRPGITLADVKEACDALKQQGRVVGPSNVRLQLGRGSMQTITQYLRALGYQSGRPARK